MAPENRAGSPRKGTQMMVGQEAGYILLALFLVPAGIRAMKRCMQAGSTLLLLCFAAYMAALAAGLFLPFYVSFDPAILPDAAGYLLRPGAWLHDVGVQLGAGRFISYLVPRVACFAPLGTGIWAVSGSSCPFRRQLAIICTIAVAIELLQLGEGLVAGAIYRRVCLDDAAIAAAGSLAGLAAGRIAWRLQSFRRGATTGIRPGI